MNAVERLPATFKTELAKLYAAVALSGSIPASRHGHVMGEVARLHRKFQQKLATARAHLPASVVDAAERQVTNIESEMRRNALS